MLPSKGNQADTQCKYAYAGSQRHLHDATPVGGKFGVRQISGNCRGADPQDDNAEKLNRHNTGESLFLFPGQQNENSADAYESEGRVGSHPAGEGSRREPVVRDQ